MFGIYGAALCLWILNMKIQIIFSHFNLDLHFGAYGNHNANSEKNNL